MGTDEIAYGQFYSDIGLFVSGGAKVSSEASSSIDFAEGVIVGGRPSFYD